MPSAIFTHSSKEVNENIGSDENSLFPPINNAFNGDFANVRNPFKTPKDMGWVDMCQEEKIRERAQKRTERLLKVHEKQTYRSRVVGATLPTVRKFFREVDEEIEKELQQEEKSSVQQALASARRIRIRPLENESNFEFKARKREMFFIKYTLQVKLDEISGYQKREAEEEKKIKEQAEHLRNEAIMFDSFLKSTDKEAAEAIKVAEKEAKLRLEKAIELRRLQATLGILKADVTRKDELLYEYLSYKSFLLMFHYNLSKPSGTDLTFDMWEKKRESKNRKKSRKGSKKKTLSKVSKKKSSIGLRRSSDLSLTRKSSKILKKASQPSHTDRPPTRERVLPSKSSYPEEWEENGVERNNSSESIVYVLEDPTIIITAVHEKEEESLRLIYRIQSHQDAFDEQKRSRQEKVTKKEKELMRLIDLVNIMQSNINSINLKCEELKLLCKLLGADEQASVDDALKNLSAKVEKVYRGVFGRVLVRLDGLAMLSCIEKRLDQLLDEVEMLPDDGVRMLQKVRDKERRLALREDKILYQKHKQEERLRKALDRANRMSLRKFGRKLMFRSAPPKFKIASAAKYDNSSDTESVFFFT